MFHLQRHLRTMKSDAPAASQPGVAFKPHTLAQISPGRQVTITSFEKMNPTYQQHLQAYGILPGRTICVLAQRPVTIIQVEQTELAFENEIARQVNVE